METTRSGPCIKVMQWTPSGEPSTPNLTAFCGASIFRSDPGLGSGRLWYNAAKKREEARMLGEPLPLNCRQPASSSLGGVGLAIPQ